MMERLNRGILRTLFWVINITIAVILIGIFVMGFLEGKEIGRAARAGVAGPLNTSWLRNLVLAGLLMRILYTGGLIYILVSLNKVLYSIMHDRLYEAWHLRYIRRIGFLVLLSPLPALVLVWFTSRGIPGGPGLLMLAGGAASSLPFSIIGLVILAIAEVYKAGIAYKQELDLTV